MYNKKEVGPIELNIPFDISKYETLHTGIYKGENTDINIALKHTMERLVRLMPNIKKSSKVLIFADENSYPAMYIGARYGCKIDCIATTEENAKLLEKIAKSHDIDSIVTVHTKPFTKTMFSDSSFDMVWALDNIHTIDDKQKVMKEAARLLIPEGRFIFSDYIKKGSKEVETKYDYLPSKDYLRLADKADLERVYLREMAPDAAKHLGFLIDHLEGNKSKLSKKLGAKEYDTLFKEISDKKSSLEEGSLDWAFFQFQKRNV